MVYLLEDDASIRDIVCYALKAQGIACLGFSEPEAFWQAIAMELPSLVLLDIMLPGEDGISVLKKLRKRFATRDVRVIMLTAKDTEYDKVTGLDAGADGYVTKPFGILELTARVRAALRRESEPDDTEINGICIKRKSREVFACGRQLTLTAKEFELLRTLMERPERVFTRSELLNGIWGYAFEGETRTVDMHIKTLRQKLGEAGGQIVTVRGVGYKLSLKGEEKSK